MDNQIGFGGGIEPGLLVYRPNVRRQHGHGLGAFFGRLASRLIPFAKEFILPHATKAAKNLAGDLLEGRNFKQSLKSNAVGVLKGVGNQLINQSGSGLRRGKKRKQTTKPKKSVKRRRVSKPKRKLKKPKGKKQKKNRGRRTTLKKNDFLTIFD